LYVGVYFRGFSESKIFVDISIRGFDTDKYHFLLFTHLNQKK